MSVRRRDLVKLGAGLSLLGSSARVALAQSTPAPSMPQTSSPTPFDNNTVRLIAQKLAKSPYNAPPQSLPSEIANLDADQYKGITYNSDYALWHGQNLSFDVEFFPRGFLYKPRIEMNEVVDGHSSRINYNADLFSYTNPVFRVSDDLGFGGLRLRYSINTPGIMEECAVFLGASYFKAVAKGQTYGLSARGFSNGTGDPKGEEFAIFREFWLEKPALGVETIVIHALLDSPSVTGAFRFTIRPGDTTIFDVQSSLFPREEIHQAGIAALAGMFFFDTNERNHVDDWRPAAHDSEALQVWTGSGQQLYRPLVNPTDLQFSAFVDDSPHGFGLMQRKRNFQNYQDLSLHYEKRPSLWIEPIGNWGNGSIDLVEIPTPNEVNDNIIAFWRPQASLQAGKEYNFVYRMYWGWDTPWPTELARVSATRIGAVPDHSDQRFFVIDFSGDSVQKPPQNNQLHLMTQVSQGTIQDVVIQDNPSIKGWRATFKFSPGDAKIAELQAQLTNDQGAISEKWMYRWTP
ncbi:glucan biosynthesis protein [Swingsia samuiensis]|uniref:Glucan biosynthesis protein G n=1 Tax=Swingsia samuiensis TaxID=1293412 RepID=A0A4Y6UHN7_9PROT|nr:glucan biosynthesis protein G [Swingsia samuiensis]QDH17109.1 glucan biosynthesis protein G [Swingsia samuiensis]